MSHAAHASANSAARAVAIDLRGCDTRSCRLGRNPGIEHVRQQGHRQCPRIHLGRPHTWASLKQNLALYGRGRSHRTICAAIARAHQPHHVLRASAQRPCGCPPRLCAMSQARHQPTGCGHEVWQWAVAGTRRIRASTTAVAAVEAVTNAQL